MQLSTESISPVALYSKRSCVAIQNDKTERESTTEANNVIQADQRATLLTSCMIIVNLAGLLRQETA